MAIKANKKYLLVGSANGPEGSNVGREVITVMIIPGVPHTLWGEMWLVTCPKGVAFEYVRQDGTQGFLDKVAVAEDWLQELPEDPPKQVERTKELDLVN
jgi:hypothetical protein